ncbi:MAG: SsrA-binding protein SmpB [Peptococcaceae bacterium]|jgi:SsrA-binding protein|nr:SsrA-binding protein SmpB [Peptococcaceae bacterium]MBQ5702297.1 SsrA-binding protein SmpB [Peptococcaceae bacterium]MBQ5858856.1 SsrA-binding protein SmpB [Peptococcaceae bacterium]
MKIITENRKARHDYTIEESFEAGIELKGTEVKSMRAGKANLKDSFAIIENGELYLYGMHISPYEQGNIFNVDPLRPRRLLMHKKEILRLLGKTREQGLTLVPLKAYFKKDKIKIELALAKGKKLYDKRDAAAEKTAKREIEKAMKERSRDF